jgi:ATP-dependent Clp protease protease subunit
MFKNLNLSLGNKGTNSYFLLMEDISTESCKDVIQWILENNLSDEKPNFLQLMVCSRGGDLHAALALVDVIAGSAIPVRTIGLGMIASAGLFIFMAGQKGYRVLTPNTTIMSHQYTTGNIGKEHELFAGVKEWTLTTERMIAHYKKHTGLTEAQIREKLLPQQDVFLSAKEAKALGICDIIKELK